jgi:hypothetical protein
VLFISRRYRLRSMVILGVRIRKLYRLRGNPMHVVANRSIEKDEEEQVAPPMVRKVVLLVENCD